MSYDWTLYKQNIQVPSSMGFETISVILRKQTPHSLAANWSAQDILGDMFLNFLKNRLGMPNFFETKLWYK